MRIAFKVGESRTAKILMTTTVTVTLEAFLLPFAKHFRDLGWQVDAVARGAASSEPCCRAFDHVWDIGWTRRPLDPRNWAGPVRQLQRLVREQHYDIVHVHTPVAAFITRYALRRLRVQQGGPRVIYTAHGFHFYEDVRGLHNREFLWAERLAGRWTDYLVVINREDEAAARKYHIVPEERVVYMPGIGVDTTRYAPEQVNERDVVNVRMELGIGPEEKLFLMIAEFNPGKRHRDAVQALALLKNEAPQAHLVFAGGGLLLDQIRRLAEGLGLGSRVHFLGVRRDIPALIRASVATLLPSEREGLPRSVMESLCLGIPVVGTDIRGIRDLLAGGAGLLVPVGRPDELAKAMAWVLAHADEARRMGEAGRKKMKDYDIRQIIHMHEELYAKFALSADPVSLYGDNTTAP